jgi:hypothetical protein
VEVHESAFALELIAGNDGEDALDKLKEAFQRLPLRQLTITCIYERTAVVRVEQ